MVFGECAFLPFSVGPPGDCPWRHYVTAVNLRSCHTRLQTELVPPPVFRYYIKSGTWFAGAVGASACGTDTAAAGRRRSRSNTMNETMDTSAISSMASPPGKASPPGTAVRRRSVPQLSKGVSTKAMLKASQAAAAPGGWVRRHLRGWLYSSSRACCNEPAWLRRQYLLLRVRCSLGLTHRVARHSNKDSRPSGTNKQDTAAAGYTQKKVAKAATKMKVKQAGARAVVAVCVSLSPLGTLLGSTRGSRAHVTAGQDFEAKHSRVAQRSRGILDNRLPRPKRRTNQVCTRSSTSPRGLAP